MLDKLWIERLNAAAFWSGAGALVVLPVGTALFEIAFGISMFLSAVVLVVERRQPLPTYWSGAVFFLLAALLSVAFAIEPGRSWKLWTKLLYLCAGLGLLRYRPQPRHLAGLFLAVGVAIGLHSLVGLGGWMLWGGELRSEIDYLQLAQIVAMTLALLAPLALCRGFSWGIRILAGVLVLLFLVHVLLSGSRAALLCLAVLLLAEIGRRSRAALWLLPPLGFVLYSALPESRRDRIREVFVVEEADKDPPSSLRMRLDMARTGVAVTARHPVLGVGLDGMRVVYDQFKVGSLENDPPASEGRRRRKWPNLHNDYVQIAAELGLLGLLGYAAMLFQVLRVGRPSDQTEEEAALSQGIRNAVCLFLLGGLFYKCFLNFYPWRLFVVLIGLDAASRVRRG